MQGNVLVRYPPFWLVVERVNTRAKARFDVVDTSVDPPVRVHGPVTRDEAEAKARSLWLVFGTSRGLFL